MAHLFMRRLRAPALGKCCCLVSSLQSGGGDSCERRRDHSGDLRQVRSCFFLPSPSINRYKPSAAHHFLAPRQPPFVHRNASEEKGKAGRCGVAGSWRRSHQRAPGRRPPSRPLVPPGGGRRADMRARPALAPSLEVRHSSSHLVWSMGMNGRPWRSSDSSSSICCSSANAILLSTHASSGYRTRTTLLATGCVMINSV